MTDRRNTEAGHLEGLDDLTQQDRQDQYADWTPVTIGHLLAEFGPAWRESLPWPILELIQRFVSGRLVDREAIDWVAGMDVWDRWQSNAEHDDRDEPEAFVDAVRAALGDV